MTSDVAGIVSAIIHLVDDHRQQNGQNGVRSDTGSIRGVATAIEKKKKKKKKKLPSPIPPPPPPPLPPLSSLLSFSFLQTYLREMLQ